MRASTVLHATWQRARRPRTWGAALLFGLVWNGTRFALGWPEPGPAEMLAPTVWVALYLVLSPVPWQWTGGEAPMAGALRGALQALPWMGGLTLSVLLLLGGLAPPQPPGRPLRPGPPERMGPHRPHPGRAEEPHPLSIHPRLWALGVAHLCFGLLLGWILADRERAERIAAAAQRTAEEARGLALQGQMNPHVLFNAISGLTELVREDPEAAERALR